MSHLILEDIAHADETGWRIGNLKKGWLWAFCCTTAVAFMVHANRSQKAAGKLIDSFVGKLVTDRYNAYNYYKSQTPALTIGLMDVLIGSGEVCNLHIRSVPVYFCTCAYGEIAGQDNFC